MQLDETRKQKEGRRWRYPVECPQCHEERYLQRSDAIRAIQNETVCYSCSQRAKGKLGYKKCIELYGNTYAITRVQHYLLAHPSTGEQQVIAALDRSGHSYEREVLYVDESGRNCLIDFVVAGRYAIEYNGGCHINHQERDLFKFNAIRTGGFQLLVLTERDLPELDAILSTFIPSLVSID